MPPNSPRKLCAIELALARFERFLSFDAVRNTGWLASLATILKFVKIPGKIARNDFVQPAADSSRPHRVNPLAPPLRWVR